MAKPTSDEKRRAFDAGFRDGSKGDLARKSSPRTYDDDELWEQYEDGYRLGLSGEAPQSEQRRQDRERHRSQNQRAAAAFGDSPKQGPGFTPGLLPWLGTIMVLPALIGFGAGGLGATQLGLDAGAVTFFEWVGSISGALGALSLFYRWRTLTFFCLCGVAITAIVYVLGSTIGPIF